MPSIPKKKPKLRKTFIPTSHKREKRQKNGTWLETHLWHAKRAHMALKWNFKLATHMNDKSHRAAYRFATERSLMHDASYHSSFKLTGTVTAIRNVMAKYADVDVSKNLSGSVCGSGLLYEAFPQGLLCPFTFHWIPALSTASETLSTDSERMESTHSALSTDSERMKSTHSALSTDSERMAALSTDSERMESTHSALSTDSERMESTHSALSTDSERIESTHSETMERSLIVWIHPSSKQQFTLLMSQSALKLEELSLQRFDFYGPRTTHILASTLRPTSPNREWDNLCAVRSSSSLTPGSVIGINVQDPRHVGIVKMQHREKHAVRNVDVASVSPPSLSFWTAFSDTHPTPATNPATVPILVIQRNAAKLQKYDKLGREVVGGLSVILPKAWAVHFWKQFIFAGMRPIGLTERSSLFFNAGIPDFPRDFPAAAVCRADAEEEGARERERWEKRPPGKRVNFAQHGVASPFCVDWGRVWMPPRGVLRRLDGAAWSDMRALAEPLLPPVDWDSAVLPVLVTLPTGTVASNARVVANGTLLGHVTTASYAFSTGHARAIATVFLNRVATLANAAVRVVNPTGESRDAVMELLAEF